MTTFVVFARGGGVTRAHTKPKSTDRREGNAADLRSPCFASRKCYRRNLEGGRTAIGRSATTCTKRSRPAGSWVIVGIVRSAVATARGSNGRGGGRRRSIIKLEYSERLRHVSGVSGILSEEERRVSAGVGGRAVVVVTLSVVARVTSRRFVWVASVIIAVTVVIVASGGISTTVRGGRRARVATLVGAHALLPKSVGLTIIA